DRAIRKPPRSRGSRAPTMCGDSALRLIPFGGLSADGGSGFVLIPEVISPHDASSYRLCSKEPFVGPRSPVKRRSYQVARNSRCQGMADGHANEPGRLSFAKKICVKDVGGDF